MSASRRLSFCTKRTGSAVPEPTLYLFDGYNLLHAGDFESVRSLRDELASFVALRGARGVLVLDGVGVDEKRGSLEVRYVPDADSLLERLAAESRRKERVCLVSSDATVLGTAGQEVGKVSSAAFLHELGPVSHDEPAGSRIRDRLDDKTRERLERLRRNR